MRKRPAHHDDDDFVKARNTRVYAQAPRRSARRAVRSSPVVIAGSRAIRQTVKTEMPKWAAISRGRSQASSIP